MKLNIKKLTPEAEYRLGSKGAAGIDLKAMSMEYLDKNTIRYNLGVAVEIPEGYFGMLVARSSVVNRGMMLTNGVGIIDSDYRGPLMAVFTIVDRVKSHYLPGEYVCQLVIVPTAKVEVNEIYQLLDTERGEGGFGSTDIA